MHIKQFLTGGDRNFGYLVADETSKKALLIDPSYSPKMIIQYAHEHTFSIEYIICTHSHEDHINGNALIEKYSAVKPVCYGDPDPHTKHKITHNSTLLLGDLAIRILHTPGHTPDSLCVAIGDAVFTGDTLFVGRIGSTFTKESAEEEYHSLHAILMKLPPKTRVFPGHNFGSTPVSTIEDERINNPFMQQPDFNSFLRFKKNWNSYKKDHAIV